MSPFDVTLTISISILAIYALTGVLNFRKARTFESFFLADRLLTTENVRNTFTGAAVSISTVLVFFLTLGVVFGWQVLYSPISLALGVILFANVFFPRISRFPGLVAALRGEGSAHVSSLGDYVYFVYRSRLLANTVTLISGAGVLAILVAEMMVGVTIYSEYFLKPEYIVFIISATLFLYAGFGGLHSVVQTDRWQVRIIVISLVSLIATLTLIASNTYGSFSVRALFLPENWTPKMSMPLALVANIFVVNMCFLPSSLRVWQVVAGSSRGNSLQAGLWQSTLVITFISVCCVFISKAVALRTGDDPSLSMIFSFLNSEGGIVAYFVYPLFITALLSALVSTADSAILPLAQTLAGRQPSEFSLSRNLRSILFLLALVIVAYFLVTRVFNLGIVGWILTVFAITTSIAPIIVVPVFTKPRIISIRRSAVIAVGIGAGFITALSWSIIFRSMETQPWNCCIGLSISGIVTICAYFTAPIDSNRLI